MIRNASMTLALIAGLAISFAASPTQAAIVYVDALDGTEAGGNTYATGGSLGVTDWFETGTAANNNDNWRKRADPFGNGGQIYEGGYVTDDPELTTEVNGLANGPYDVWVFFWDATGTNTWNIAAGLTSGSLTTYSFDGLGNTTDPVAASTLDYLVDPLFVESNRTLYAAYLGTANVAGGTLQVFIDNGGGAPDDRTWYDGIGYEFVPEPASMALLAMGGLVIARRRK